VSDKAATSAATHLSTLTDVAATARGLHASAEAYTRATAADAATLTSTLLASHAKATADSGRAHARAKRKLEAMASATAGFVDALAADEPTGDTPRKRAYHLPSWERTAPRPVLLERIRRGSPLVPPPRVETPDVDVSSTDVASPEEPRIPSRTSSTASLPGLPERSASFSERPAPERSASYPERPPVERAGSYSERPPPERSASSSMRPERSSDLPLNVSTRRRTKLGSAEFEHPPMGVLKEGGNIPRRRR
jgi:hypothetical protein